MAEILMALVAVMWKVADLAEIGIWKIWECMVCLKAIIAEVVCPL
jgi:hypothetical protein